MFTTPQNSAMPPEKREGLAYKGRENES